LISIGALLNVLTDNSQSRALTVMVAAGPFHLSSVAANVDPSRPFANGVALNTTPLDDLMQQVRRCKVPRAGLW
jgi:hypothetical protein